MQWIHVCVLTAAMAGSVWAKPVVLEAAKDNFGRSNQRTQNSGGSEMLWVAQAPSIRSIVAYDLSQITNEIVSAEMRILPAQGAPTPIDLVVAPMVQTANNAAWGEGDGNLGVQGRNARPGESCYARSAFPDTPWEGASGQPVQDLSASLLWLPPIARFEKLSWVQGGWVNIPVADVQLLERIRASETPLATFGLWGTSGQGLYAISSRESGQGPKLVLTVRGEAE